MSVAHCNMYLIILISYICFSIFCLLNNEYEAWENSASVLPRHLMWLTDVFLAFQRLTLAGSDSALIIP